MRGRQTLAIFPESHSRLKTIELGRLVVHREVLITSFCTKENPKPPAQDPEDGWARESFGANGGRPMSAERSPCAIELGDKKQPKVAASSPDPCRLNSSG